MQQMVAEFKFAESRLARREIVARQGAQAGVIWPPVHPGASDAQLGSALADDRGCGPADRTPPAVAGRTDRCADCAHRDPGSPAQCFPNLTSPIRPAAAE